MIAGFTRRNRPSQHSRRQSKMLLRRLGGKLIGHISKEEQIGGGFPCVSPGRASFQENQGVASPGSLISLCNLFLRGLSSSPAYGYDP